MSVVYGAPVTGTVARVVVAAVRDSLRSNESASTSTSTSKNTNQQHKTAETPKDLKLEPGKNQNIDPKKLSTDRMHIDSKRLETQSELLRTGKSSSAGNVKVDQAGNIIDGTHRTRAAIEAGKDVVKVDVHKMPNAVPGRLHVQEVPVH